MREVNRRGFLKTALGLGLAEAACSKKEEYKTFRPPGLSYRIEKPVGWEYIPMREDADFSVDGYLTPEKFLFTSTPPSNGVFIEVRPMPRGRTDYPLYLYVADYITQKSLEADIPMTRNSPNFVVASPEKLEEKGWSTVSGNQTFITKLEITHINPPGVFYSALFFAQGKLWAVNLVVEKPDEERLLPIYKHILKTLQIDS